ncbi:MAG: hypothetical protein ACRDY6_09975, partial [Acidimicrobiia bacterium]
MKTLAAVDPVASSKLPSPSRSHSSVLIPASASDAEVKVTVCSTRGALGEKLNAAMGGMVGSQSSPIGQAAAAGATPTMMLASVAATPMT